MKRLKANRLSHFAYGETFPTPKQAAMRKALEQQYMTTTEAYDLAMQTVLDLKASGIKTTIKPSKCRNDADTVAEYNRPGRVAPDKWVNVSFYPRATGDSQRIAEAADKLGQLGIQFDTGGMAGQRDWELDRSFHLLSTWVADRKVARKVVENLLVGQEEGRKA